MLSNQETTVLTLIDHHLTELVADLQRMVRFRTVTPAIDARAEGEAYREHQRFIRGLLDDLGFETEAWEVDAAQLEEGPGRGVIPQRDMSGMPVVSGRLPSSGTGRSLILNGHYDVVPAGDEGLWTHDPFGASVADGRVYGRGSADMKGGNAAILFALRMIREAGLALQGDLTVQIVPDEEATCMGTLSCVQRGVSADAAFIPEPSGMGVMVAMRGSVYGSISVRGRAGHAEMEQPPWPEGGAVNAISKAAKVVAELDRLAERWRNDPDRRHPHTGADKIIPTVIRGGEWEVTYPDQVEIRFGAMVGPGRGNPAAEIEAALQKLGEDDPWLAAHPPEVRTGPFYYPAEVAEDEPVVRLGEEVLTAVGVTPKRMGIGSLTDAIHLINLAGIPTISIGPATETIHAVDEFIEIEELVTLCRAIALLIMRWCGVN